MSEWVILNQDITSLSKGHPISLKDDGACSEAIGATSKFYVLKVTDKPRSECIQYFAAEYDFVANPKIKVRQKQYKVMVDEFPQTNLDELSSTKMTTISWAVLSPYLLDEKTGLRVG